MNTTELPDVVTEGMEQGQTLPVVQWIEENEMTRERVLALYGALLPFDHVRGRGEGGLTSGARERVFHVLVRHACELPPSLLARALDRASCYEALASNPHLDTSTRQNLWYRLLGVVDEADLQGGLLYQEVVRAFLALERSMGALPEIWRAEFRARARQDAERARMAVRRRRGRGEDGGERPVFASMRALVGRDGAEVRDLEALLPFDDMDWGFLRTLLGHEQATPAFWRLALDTQRGEEKAVAILLSQNDVAAREPATRARLREHVADIRVVVYLLERPLENGEDDPQLLAHMVDRDPAAALTVIEQMGARRRARIPVGVVRPLLAHPARELRMRAMSYLGDFRSAEEMVDATPRARGKVR